MKKLLSVILIVVFAFAAISCSRSGFYAGSSRGPDGEFIDYSNGFPDRVTIEIPVYERAFEGWNVNNNYWTRWIQQNFGDKYNVEVKFVPIGRVSEVQDYNQMLASRRAPNIVFHYDMPQMVTYYSQDVLQEIDLEELQHYAPSFWKHSGRVIEKYGTINNKNMFFFAERLEADNFIGIIRKDWVEKAGFKLEDINSLDKYNEMLARWRDLGLGHGGGGMIQNHFVYSYPFRDWPINEKERILYSDLSVADFTWRPSYDFLKNMNFQYNRNLIDSEFFLTSTDAKAKADFVSGRSGVYALYVSSNADVFDALKANDPGAEIWLGPENALPAGKVPQARAYWPFGMIMGINSRTTAQSRVAIWMYLEWLSQPENLFVLQNGIEGEDFNFNERGVPIKTGVRTPSSLSVNNNKDYWCLVTEGYRYENEDIFWEVNKNTWSPPGYEDMIVEHIRRYKETVVYRTPDAMFTVVLNKVNEFKGDLNHLFQQLFVQCVTVPETQFETVYAEACRRFLAAGYQEILEEKQKAIDEGNYIY